MTPYNYFKFCLLAILLMLSTSAFSQPDPNFHIYLAFGQSNMEGNATIGQQDKTVDSRFKVMEATDCSNLGRSKEKWYPAIPPLCRCYTGLTPADYFGRTMVARLPSNIKIGVVMVAVAGCKIELFDKNNYQAYVSTVPSWMLSIINEYGGNPYQRLVDLAKLAQKDGIIKGILLHQGESNTGDNTWPSKVKGIYDNLIQDLSLKPESVPLLAGEVVNADQGGVCASMNTIIATLPQTLPNSYVIPSKGCTDTTDNLHFNAAGYRELGTRYAREMLKVVYNICDSTTTEPWYKINNGTLKQGDSILVNHGTTLVLSPHPTNGLGTWSWTGAGTSGSSREQTVNTATEGTYTAVSTYTNECGASSYLPIKIIVCDSTTTESWYQSNGGDWTQSTTIRALRGSTLVLGPRPSDGTGTWSWNGAGTSGTSREQTVSITNVNTSTALATYTNGCGAKSHLSIRILVCDSTAIESWYQVDGGDWIKSDSIRVKQGVNLKLGPNPTLVGSWNWTGAGTSGTSREQTVNTSIPGTYTALATYTNTCDILSHQSIQIIVDPTTALNENRIEVNPLEIYPNPVRNSITIKGSFALASLTNLNGIITNMLGQVVLTFNFKPPTSDVDISQLDAGTYYLKLVSNNRIGVKKFVKTIHP